MAVKKNVHIESLRIKPPKNVEVIETPITIHWFDENGIMYVMSKKVERTMEYYSMVINVYASFVKEKGKLCTLSDTHNTMPMSKEVRDYLTKEMPKYIKAQAVITDEPLNGSKFKTFLSLSLKGFKVALFSNEKDAKKWLKEQL